MMRAMSGITELDEMLRGGFMQGDSVLAAGSVGTGKITLAPQYLVNGVTQFGENGAFHRVRRAHDRFAKKNNDQRSS